MLYSEMYWKCCTVKGCERNDVQEIAVPQNVQECCTLNVVEVMLYRKVLYNETSRKCFTVKYCKIDDVQKTAVPWNVQECCTVNAVKEKLYMKTAVQ